MAGRSHKPGTKAQQAVGVASRVLPLTAADLQAIRKCDAICDTRPVGHGVSQECPECGIHNPIGCEKCPTCGQILSLSE